MRLVRNFESLVFALILSLGTACKKSITIVEQVKPAPSVDLVKAVVTVDQPVVKQEVLVSANAGPVIETESPSKIEINTSDNVDRTGIVSKFVVEDINFDLDSYLIREIDKAKLQAIAELLRVNPEMKMQIIGNCDERGTAEYNLVLGERRAHAAHNYLLGLGIVGNRLFTISYGKERPKADGHNKESWFINRNCQFLPQ